MNLYEMTRILGTDEMVELVEHCGHLSLSEFVHIARVRVRSLNRDPLRRFVRRRNESNQACAWRNHRVILTCLRNMERHKWE